MAVPAFSLHASSLSLAPQLSRAGTQHVSFPVKVVACPQYSCSRLLSILILFCRSVKMLNIIEQLILRPSHHCSCLALIS